MRTGTIRSTRARPSTTGLPSSPAVTSGNFSASSRCSRARDEKVMQGPQRPFESLDWYREAQGGRDDEHPWLTRLRSFSAVQAHVSLFALGSVLLLAMNLIRSPGDVRADTWIAIWGLIVIMHAVVTGIASLM